MYMVKNSIILFGISIKAKHERYLYVYIFLYLASSVINTDQIILVSIDYEQFDVQSN